jgi:sulfotransferase family protein
VKTIIYIASDVRSGSTLLDNMISNHPQIESVGELRQLTAHINMQPSDAAMYPSAFVQNRVCTCTKPFHECSVWSQVRDIYEAEQERPFVNVETGCSKDLRSRIFHLAMLLAWLIPVRGIRRWLFCRAFSQEPLEKSGHTCYQLLDAFSRTVDVETIVDSSKTVQQLYAMIAARPKDCGLKVIHLVRDGRAVTYSKLKRAQQYRDLGVSFKLIPAIRGWCYINLQISLSRCFFGSTDFTTIRYEDLCQDRESTLRKACEKLDLPFDAAMLYLSTDDKHNVGGSSHRFDWNAATSIEVDNRWKTGMRAWHKVAYYIVAGMLHKRLGY